KIKNIIFLIGDGMGPTYNTAYRSFKDDPSTPYVEKTAFDDYLVGMQQTYSWDQEERDRKSTRLNSSHVSISYAVFCWKKKRHIVEKTDQLFPCDVMLPDASFSCLFTRSLEKTECQVHVASSTAHAKGRLPVITTWLIT